MKYKTLEESGLKPLREYMDEHIEAIHANDEDRTKHVHVTELTSQCPVGVWLQKTGKVKPDHNVSKLRRFEVGHQVENVVRAALLKRCLLPVDAIVWNEFGLKGTPDLRIVNEDMKEFVVEVKSIHPMALDAMQGKPHDHYVEQLNTYIGGLKDKLDKVITGRLFYVSLDGRTNEFIVDFDSALYDETLTKAAAMKWSIDQETCPLPLDRFVLEGDKYKLNWKVKYCIADGVHEYCEAALAGKPLPTVLMSEEDRKKWIGRLEYQAKKKTEQLYQESLPTKE